MSNAELTEAQRDGRACIRCGREDAPRMVPIGHLIANPTCQVFECDPPCSASRARARSSAGTYRNIEEETGHAPWHPGVERDGI